MKNSSQLEIINKDDLDSVFAFLEKVFSKEQHIPKELIPIRHEKQHWWCIRDGENIVGCVAAWSEKGTWHWGRLAVDAGHRGKGYAKELAIDSFKKLIDLGINEIIIDAREITVSLLLSLGGEITGPTEDFFGFPITPMKLRKVDFLRSISS